MMNSPSPAKARQPARPIELNLRDVGQLFNTMDPSPFHRKDLDHDAEEFIESWAREFPAETPLKLVLHLENFPAEGCPQTMVEEAIHHYFAYRVEINRLAFRRLMAEGRRCMVIGLLFLGACLMVSDQLLKMSSGTTMKILCESLTIGGWVAMWRPMEIYLYDWWPVKQRGRILRKLSRMPVEVRKKPAKPT